MKKLINRVLSIITALVMIFLSIAPSITTAYADEAPAKDKVSTPDTPDSSLTEQTLTATIYQNGRYNTILDDDPTEITLTGNMPEGAVVKAYPVEYDLAPTERSDVPDKDGTPDAEGSVVLAYDISIFDGKTEFEPEGDSISVTFKSPELEQIDESDLSVIHLKDNGEEEEIIEKSADIGELTVETDGFSVFLIVKHENGDIVKPRVIFHYLNYIYTENNGEYTSSPYYFDTKSNTSPKVQVCSQIVKDGETLDYVPTPPDHNLSHFNGWYIVDKVSETNNNVTYTWPSDPTRQVFNQTVTVTMSAADQTGTAVTWSIGNITRRSYADAEGAVHVYLAPLYVNYRFVNFYDADNTLIARKLLVLDSNNKATMLISDMEATNLEGNYYFMGWSKMPFTRQNNQQDSTNTVSLYQDGYKKITYITLYQSDENTIQIYEGKTMTGTPLMSIASTVSGNVDLYAEYEQAHWVRFISGETGWGSLYVPADCLLGSTPASKLKVTERNGYRFEGWCCGYQDANGTIHYRLNDGNYVSAADNTHNLSDYCLVSNGTASQTVDGETVSYSPVVTGKNFEIMSGNPPVSTGNVGSGGSLTTIADTYLYAKWSPRLDTSYKVVIWKQKITDGVYLPDEDKTYDYYDMRTVDNVSSQTVIGTLEGTAAADALHFCDPSSQFNNPNGAFTGFDLGRYDSLNVAPDPQGTTVINVYYDRKVHTLHFQANYVNSYTWSVAEDDNGIQYGIVDGAYTELTRVSDGTYNKYEYSPAYKFSANEDPVMFGIVDGQYVQLIRSPIYEDREVDVPIYKQTNTLTAGSNYLIVNSNTAGSNQYALGRSGTDVVRDTVNINAGTTATDNKVYILPSEVYETSIWSVSGSYKFKNGTYYLRRSRSNDALNIATTDSNNTWSWDGNNNRLSNSNRYLRYYKNTFSLSTSTNIVYLYVESTMKEIQNTLVGYKYIYNGVEYTGSRFLPDGTAEYNDTRYTDAACTTVATTHGSGQYGKDSNGVIYPLIYTTGPKYKWTYVDDNGQTQTYTAKRFKRNNAAGSSWKDVYTITALYGQNIGSHFPISSWTGIHYNTGQRWDPQNFSSTQNTNGYQNAFEKVLVYIDSMPDSDVTFRLDTSSNTTKHLYYYIEPLPDADLTGLETRIYNGKTFVRYKKIDANYGYFTEREDYLNLNGFYKSADYVPQGYTYTGDTLPSGNADRTGSDVWGSGKGLYHIVCYYLRNSTNQKLTFAVNYPGGATFEEGNKVRSENMVYNNMPYEQPLTNYANVAVPTAPDHYTFDGWYEDMSCTKKFDFANEKMPNGNKVVYAKWYPKYYRVKIDPNGGQVAGTDRQNESTYFWLQYGTTIGRYSIERDYVEAEVTSQTANAAPQDYYYYRYVTFNGVEHSRIVYLGNNQYDLYCWHVDENDPNYSDHKDYEGIRPAYFREAEYISIYDYHTERDAFYQTLVNGFKKYDSTLTTTQAQALADAWDENYIDKSKYYRKLIPQNGDPSWSLVGWNRVDNEGTASETLTPYDFGTAVTGDVTLRADWRQSGQYYIRYNANMTQAESSTGVHVIAEFSSGHEIYDPVVPNSSDDIQGYADRAQTHAQIAPQNIRGGAGDNNVFQFEGWRVVNASGEPLDRNGNVITNGTGELFQPGDLIEVLHEQVSNSSGDTIYMEAYYSAISVSHRNPDVTSITLNPNTTQGGSIDPNAAVMPDWGKPGDSSIPYNSSEDVYEILFNNTQLNIDLNLFDYRKFFKNSENFFLLGFDEQPNPMLIKDENGNTTPYIPKYPADSVIAFDNRETLPNKLYAIWEPMVYTTFVNNTGADIRLDITGSTYTDIILVNDATKPYERSAIEHRDYIVVTAGKTLRIVVPHGQNGLLDVKFTNDHPGFLMDAFVTNPDQGLSNSQIADDLAYRAPDVRNQQTMFYSSVGITYRFEEEALPEATFDVNGGTWTHNYKGPTYSGGGTHSDSSLYTHLSGTTGTTDYGRFKIDVAKLNSTTKPSDPTPPTNSGRQFIGWTSDPVIARITDFSKPVSSIDTSAVITTQLERQHLWDLVNTYCSKYNVRQEDIDNLLQVVEVSSFYNFSDPAGGCVYYAVYADTVTVNFHLMYERGTTDSNHTWGGVAADETYQPVERNDSADNRRHLIYTRNVVKGRIVVKPKAPSYNAANSNYNFLYWLKDDYSHTAVSIEPSSVTPHDFSVPVTENLDLYTSWTERKFCTVTLEKKLEGTYQHNVGGEQERFVLSYTIITYRYYAVGGVITRTAGQELNPSIDPVSSSKTILPNNLNNTDQTLKIPLYYWTSGNYLYEQEIQISENDYVANGYTLTVEGATTSTNKGKYETGIYYYAPFYNYATGENEIKCFTNYNGSPVWSYYVDSENSPVFWSNTWYSSGSNIGSSSAISAPTQLDVNNLVFTNTRYAAVRFVKVDNGGVNRLNGGEFTIQGLDENDTPITDRVLTMTAKSFTANGESAPKRGRMIANNSSSADGKLAFDFAEAEVLFKEDGNYLLTEVKPPTGYVLPENPVVPIRVKNGSITADGTYNGTANNLLVFQRLREWNNHEVTADNEFALVVKDDPIKTKVVIQSVDSSGTPITAPNASRSAVFGLSGHTTQTAEIIADTLTVNTSTARTAVKELLYGEYTLEQTTTPGDEYKTAEEISIVIDAGAANESPTMVRATGASVYGVKFDNTTQMCVVSVINEVEGYNLTVAKYIIGDDTGQSFTVEITASDASKVNAKSFNVRQKTTGDFVSDTPITFTNGKATISLIAGQQKEIRALPKDITYTVIEIDANTYSAQFYASRATDHNTSVGTQVTGGISFSLTSNILAEITNDLRKTPAPTAVGQVKRAAFVSLITLCTFGAGIYLMLSKRRKEVGYDAI